jgi:hypothetical protein
MSLRGFIEGNEENARAAMVLENAVVIVKEGKSEAVFETNPPA